MNYFITTEKVPQFQIPKKFFKSHLIVYGLLGKEQQLTYSTAL